MLNERWAQTDAVFVLVTTISPATLYWIPTVRTLLRGLPNRIAHSPSKTTTSAENAGSFVCTFQHAACLAILSCEYSPNYSVILVLISLVGLARHSKPTSNRLAPLRTVAALLFAQKSQVLPSPCKIVIFPDTHLDEYLSVQKREADSREDLTVLGIIGLNL